MNERARILNMVSEGKITVEEAEKLMDAVEAKGAPETEAIELKDRRGRKPKKLRVNIDAGENSKKAKVNVSIPLSIVRTFGPIVVKNLPKEAKEELDKSGVDLSRIVNDIEGIIAEASEEDIVNIDTVGEDAAKVRIFLE
jgi:hypothetical protein